MRDYCEFYSVSFLAHCLRLAGKGNNSLLKMFLDYLFWEITNLPKKKKKDIEEGRKDFFPIDLIQSDLYESPVLIRFFFFLFLINYI